MPRSSGALLFCEPQSSVTLYLCKKCHGLWGIACNNAPVLRGNSWFIGKCHGAYGALYFTLPQSYLATFGLKKKTATERWDVVKYNAPKLRRAVHNNGNMAPRVWGTHAPPMFCLWTSALILTLITKHPTKHHITLLIQIITGIGLYNFQLH